MANPWDIRSSESVGKAIPNEISKLSPWLQWIPVIGQALKIIGAVDAGTTTYSDIYNQQKDTPAGRQRNKNRLGAIMPTVQQTMGSWMGGANPGAYGSGGNIDRNWADYVGMAGGVFNTVGGMMNGGNTASGAKSLFGQGQKIYGAASGNEDAPQVSAAQPTMPVSNSYGYQNYNPNVINGNTFTVPWR